MKLWGFIVISASMFIGGCQSEARPIENYEEARRILWQSIYPYSAKTLYCGQKFDSDFRKGINIEHVFPMSWATHALKCGTRKQCRVKSDLFNRIEADLHNLFPARTDVNADRGAFAFGEIKGESRRYGKSCDFEISERQRIAEPAPQIRGDIARAMFYMAYQYKDHGLRIFTRPGRVLQSWNLDDPPSAEEIKRNDRIESIQGNRNQFIDDPDMLNQLIDKGIFFKN